MAKKNTKSKKRKSPPPKPPKNPATMNFLKHALRGKTDPIERRLAFEDYLAYQSEDELRMILEFGKEFDSRLAKFLKVSDALIHTASYISGNQGIVYEMMWVVLGYDPVKPVERVEQFKQGEENTQNPYKGEKFNALRKSMSSSLNRGRFHALGRRGVNS